MKEDFPILQRKINGKELVYLDNSATTQKPQQVIDAVVSFYKETNANVHRGIHTLSEEASQMYEEARETAAKFIHAKKEEIIFTSGTTESLNALAYMLEEELQEGDEIILSEMEHHANIVPWQELAKRKKLQIKYIPITKEYRLDLKKAKELITDKTKLVSIVHISNTLGSINPIKEIIKIAHNVNAYAIIDAAQSAPHIPLNVKELDCDFLAFSGHKMLAPTGIGVLYGKKELLEKLPPYFFGGGMIKEVTKEKTSFANIPEKFEAGTPKIAQAIGLAKAIEYLQKIGMKNIEKQQKELTAYTLKELQKVPGLQIIGPQDARNRAAVFSFTIDGIHTHDIAEILNREGIAVRSGNHCTMPLHNKLGLSGTTRASLYIYNTKDDIDKLINGIKIAQEIFK